MWKLNNRQIRVLHSRPLAIRGLGDFRERPHLAESTGETMKEDGRKKNDTVSIPMSRFPVDQRLRLRLAGDAQLELTSLGNLDMLALSKTALFCSARCPGSVILPIYDQAARWRDTGRCIISGFHSPVEKECLRILLRGKQPIIICPARALPQHIPAEWRTPLAEGRLLILSGFTATEKRVTKELATRRNTLVAALADEAYFAHITPGGQSDRLTQRLTAWQIPFSTQQIIEP
jgi:hypothetical protein